MADMGLILSAYFEELRFGVIGCEELRRRREQGSYSMELHMFTDSYSIFSYLKAAHLKFPAEKATYLHLAYLKELLDTGAVKSLTWVDTRDMVIDGLTKGMADRSAIHRLMAGVWKLCHPCETFAGGDSGMNPHNNQPSSSLSQQLQAEFVSYCRNDRRRSSDWVDNCWRKFWG